MSKPPNHDPRSSETRPIRTNAASATEVRRYLGTDVRDAGVEVVSDATAEESDFVVCEDLDAPTPFVDNVETACALCGRGIRHRPHAPKRPPKVCRRCADVLMSAAEVD